RHAVVELVPGDDDTVFETGHPGITPAVEHHFDACFLQVAQVHDVVDVAEGVHVRPAHGYLAHVTSGHARPLSRGSACGRSRCADAPPPGRVVRPCSSRRTRSCPRTRTT